MSKEIYVVDTCTLVYFYSNLKSQHILYSLFLDRLKIVPEVKKELLKLAKKKGFHKEVINDLHEGFLQIEEVDLYDQRVQDFILKFESTLDTGERFSAALALIKGYILLIDDWEARKAIMFGYASITCKDSKWILDCARRNRYIGEKEHKRLKKKLYKAKSRKSR